MRFYSSAAVSAAAVLSGAIGILGAGGSGAGDAARLSRLLSQTGLYSGAGTTIDPRNLSYLPQYPLWSDGAQKSRWIFLPPGSRIDTTDVDGWEFPVGTKFWKQFAFGGRKVETRLLWKATPSGWTYATYLWNSEQTDAVLASPDGVPEYHEIAPGKRHNIPSVSDCKDCHESETKPVLGFTALQLSTDRDPLAPNAEPLQPGMLTLRTLVERRLLKPARDELVREPPRIPTANPRTRAMLGYFAANCSHCHAPSSSLGILELSFAHRSTARSEVDEPGLATTVGRESRWQIPDAPDGAARRIQPGSPGLSTVFYRMNSRHPSSQMPPLGTVLVDQEAVDLLARWITEDLPKGRLPSGGASFGDDTAFLKSHTDLIVLSDEHGLAKVAVTPAWQGRVMTSTAGGDAGRSFGWINRELIASGKLLPHMNAFGGEDRFWMGPEGGQFSIFFAKGARFEFADWQTPPVFDTLPFTVAGQSPRQAAFAAKFILTNYSGTRFDVAVNRAVRLLDTAAAWKKLGVQPGQDVSLVAYETDNQITNAGKDPWKKETGLLSIWILGMFNPSPFATIVAPINSGPESELGPKVTSDYFGSIPPNRLVVRDGVVFLSADGKFRSKIGLSPKRSKAVLGSYDADNKVLTIVQFTQPAGVTDYVNSLWKLQDNPYGGDAANSYNDGPATPGAKPMGPFFELESSSPAAALAPGESLSHVHRTIHLSGPESALDAVARATLGVSLAAIKTALQSP